MYRVFSAINAAETWRDPDDIRETEHGYFKEESDAVAAAERFIQKSFFKTDRRLQQVVSGDKYCGKQLKEGWYAVDSGSWAPTIIIQKVEVQ